MKAKPQRKKAKVFMIDMNKLIIIQIRIRNK